MTTVLILMAAMLAAKDKSRAVAAALPEGNNGIAAKSLQGAILKASEGVLF